MDAQGSFDFKKTCIYCTVYVFCTFRISGNSSNRGYLRCPFRRGSCSKKYCDDSYNNPADNSNDADTKQRDIRKFLSDNKTQSGTQTPSRHGSKYKSCRNCSFTPVQCFQPDKTDDLTFAHSDAAHHSEKFCSLSYVAVDAA